MVTDGPFPNPVPGITPADDPGIAQRRDRLLAALTLIAGCGLALGLPFALSAGREFFLPVTAALVIAIALVPPLQALERKGVPSALAALLCVLSFLVAVNIALAAIVVPATEWVRLLPQRLVRIQSNIQPLLELYDNLQRFVDQTVRTMASRAEVQNPQSTAVAPPNSLLELAATSAPAALIQMFFGLLLIFFLLSGWTRMRRSTIEARSSFSGALATARVIHNVVEATAAYLGTITAINVALGLVVAGVLWALGMPSPLMWGGIVTLLNYVPYLGPVFASVLLTLGGLMTFTDVRVALIPAGVMVGLHLIEANALTPFIVGRRLTINPVMILISISFWSWIWGPLGAILAVPLLIIIQTVVAAAGKPDIAGFLFEAGTLTHTADEGGDRLDSPGGVA